MASRWSIHRQAKASAEAELDSILKKTQNSSNRNDENCSAGDYEQMTTDFGGNDVDAVAQSQMSNLEYSSSKEMHSHEILLECSSEMEIDSGENNPFSYEWLEKELENLPTDSEPNPDENETYDDEVREDVKNIAEKIREWAETFKVHQNATSALLSILQLPVRYEDSDDDTPSQKRRVPPAPPAPPLLMETIPGPSQGMAPTPPPPAPQSQGVFVDRTLLQTILTKQEECLRHIKVMHRTIQELKSRDHIREDPSEEVLDQIRLPIDTLGNLNLVEEELQKPEVSAALVNKLAKIGGRDPGDVIRKILARLLTNKLARECNWRGVGGKQCFSSLQLLKVIVNASQKNSDLGQIKEKFVVETTQKWLRTAGDRDGGRQERTMKKLNQTTRPPQGQDLPPTNYLSQETLTLDLSSF